jgi:hemerythrin-like domain-containing protein
MSKAIDELTHDHDAILSALNILDAMVGRLGSAGAPSAEDLRSFIGFLKEFADKCHHGKEEGILFPALTGAGLPQQGGPVAVMLSEHVEGRAFIKQMEQAVSGAVDMAAFTAAAQGYAALLRAHIAKENDVLFPMAERLLASPELDKIQGQFEQHEETVIGHGRHEELHRMLKDLRKKYLA